MLSYNIILLLTCRVLVLFIFGVIVTYIFGVIVTYVRTIDQTNKQTKSCGGPLIQKLWGTVEPLSQSAAAVPARPTTTPKMHK